MEFAQELGKAFPGLDISALGLPPAAASQSPPRRALIPTCSAPGFQFLLMWHVYGPADLDGQQAASNPGSVPRVSYPCTGADKPEATSDDQDTWKCLPLPTPV